ncbi:MAG: sugar transferase, partial [Kiloniellales bacterium]|nr:sugar transferase [Kiloniellales bacterium]
DYRHVVKPGISGWAQLQYPYGSTVEDAKEKLAYDLFYIKNYSWMLDLVILLQTLRVVVWPLSQKPAVPFEAGAESSVQG